MMRTRNATREADADANVDDRVGDTPTARKPAAAPPDTNTRTWLVAIPVIATVLEYLSLVGFPCLSVSVWLLQLADLLSRGFFFLGRIAGLVAGFLGIFELATLATAITNVSGGILGVSLSWGNVAIGLYEQAVLSSNIGIVVGGAVLLAVALGLYAAERGTAAAKVGVFLLAAIAVAVAVHVFQRGATLFNADVVAWDFVVRVGDMFGVPHKK